MENEVANPHWLRYLEVLFQVLTPIIGGVIAYLLYRLEKKQWAGRKVVEKRLDFYDRVVPELNDLYCYYHRIGNWKELLPKELIKKKRYLDKQFYIYSHLFEKNILTQYNIYIENCFETFTGSGNDAKLKMPLAKRTALPNWKDEWNGLFNVNEIVSKQEFNRSYDTLLKSIKDELEIKAKK